MHPIEEHFDKLAPSYDANKAKNSYYYKNLKDVYRQRIKPGSSVLEIGCGTGGVLASLEPERGVGVDISEKMISLAEEKYKANPNLRFIRGDAATFTSGESFDYILLPDVIEHLSDTTAVFRNVRRLMGHDTEYIISMANPLWEPILFLAEKLKLKMDEGPHYRMPLRALLRLLQTEGFRVVSADYSLLLPIYLPWVSKFFNTVLIRLPLIKKFGFTIVVTAKLTT